MPIDLRLNSGHSSAIKMDSIDLCFAEQDSPIVLGIRIVGNDIDNRIEAACVGVLSYADESRRTVDSLLNCS